MELEFKVFTGIHRGQASYHLSQSAGALRSSSPNHSWRRHICIWSFTYYQMAVKGLLPLPPAPLPPVSRITLNWKKRNCPWYMELRNYSTTMGEGLTQVTDHKPLTAILGPKKGVPSLAAARLQCIPEESVSCVLDAYKFLVMALNWSIRMKTVLEDLILIHL